MQAVKTFDSTGIAPNGRVYATDLNAIQAAAAGLTDLAQTISLGSLVVGESGLAISRVGAGEMQAAGGFRSTGILRGLGGIYAGQLTTTQRDAIGAGYAPTGLIIFNTTTGQFEWNSGTDGARVWKSLGLDTTLDLILTGVASSVDFTAQNAGNYPFTAKRAADTVPRIAIKEDGTIEWGVGGVTARDVILQRIGVDRLGMGASDKFVLSSAGVEFSDASTLLSGLINRIGNLASRPAANSVQAGTTYFATDQVVDYISDGTSWYRKSNPAGTVASWYLTSGAAPTGWQIYDGSVMPSSTGIYADLFSHLGTTTTPDTRGRAPVGKGTHGDVDAIGDNDGLGVGVRRPAHKHTSVPPAISAPTHSLTLPAHVHSPGGTEPNYGSAITYGSTQNSASINGGNDLHLGSTANTGNPTTSPAINGAIGTPVASGGSVGPQTGSEPTDTIPYIVTAYIAKL